MWLTQDSKVLNTQNLIRTYVSESQASIKTSKPLLYTGAEDPETDPRKQRLAFEFQWHLGEEAPRHQWQNLRVTDKG